MSDLKLNPYDRLQSILSENRKGQLTATASDRIDYLLGRKRNLFYRMLDFFAKIDGYIFKKNISLYNTTFFRRSR